MAEKKTNEILEEQRRARQEFLNLKKMQQGQMYAGPKPSETATVFNTPKEKFKHFWEYSKWYVIFGTLLTALIAFLVVQCATKTEYDLKVVYFTYDTVLDEQLKPVEKYLSKYGKDLYCYSDTDSIHTLLPIEELKQFCEIDDVELRKMET